MIKHVAFGAAVFCLACSSTAPESSAQPLASSKVEPAGTGRPKLWLSSVKQAEESLLTVNFKRGSNAGPRVAEIRLGYSDTLEYVSTDPGGSVTTAQKDLLTQTPQNGIVRLVVLSRDGAELGDGTIATLHFHHKDASQAKADILMDKPVFAPVEAMQGLVIGDPVEL